MGDEEDDEAQEGDEGNEEGETDDDDGDDDDDDDFSEPPTVLPKDDVLVSMVGSDYKYLHLAPGSIGDFGGNMTGHSVRAIYDESFACNGKLPNRCIARLSGNVVAERWRGSYLLVAFDEDTEEFDSYNMLNMDTRDFTLALDALRAHYFQIAPLMTKMHGVRLDTASNQFRIVNVPRRHPIYSSGIGSEIASEVGFPLIMLECSASFDTTTSYGGGTDHSPVETRDQSGPTRIASLYISLDPSSAEFGNVPSDITKKKDSDVLLTKPKGQELAVDDVLRLCDTIAANASMLQETSLPREQRRLRFIDKVAEFWKSAPVAVDAKQDTKHLSSNGVDKGESIAAESPQLDQTQTDDVQAQAENTTIEGSMAIDMSQLKL